MVLFHTDLDNTMIYSYKHEIGADKRCAEVYHGREISYITKETYRLLQQIKAKEEQLVMVPTTTRTTEQYQRIHLGIGDLPYALVCNGGVLLAGGRRIGIAVRWNVSATAGRRFIRRWNFWIRSLGEALNCVL